MDYSRLNVGCQEGVVGCPDKRFDWQGKRRKGISLARLYEKAGMHDLANRAGYCATYLEFAVSKDRDGVEVDRRLQTANFCQLRLCPTCIGRRALRSAHKLSQVLDQVELDHPEAGVKYVFLTLTIDNIYTGEALSKALNDIVAVGWRALYKQRKIERAVYGWYRSVEITRRDKGYHPHLHVILAVPSDYWPGNLDKWVDQKEWRRRWAAAAGLSYDPRVYVEFAYIKGHKGETIGHSRELWHSAVMESSKYATKDTDYISPKLSDDEAVQIVKDYTAALHRRRLVAYGGWMRDAARRVGAEDEGDLVHIGDELPIRPDVAQLIEIYRWNFGAGDYVLTDQQINPLAVRYGVDVEADDTFEG